MTPTPDPPPAAPLTAERHLTGAPFSEIRERALREALWSRIQLREGRWDFALQDIADFFATIDANRTETAALRDRLARAEARVADLEGTLRAVGNSGTVGYGLPGCPFCGCDMGEPHDEECVIAVALAAPTDGAARDGE